MLLDLGVRRSNRVSNLCCWHLRRRYGRVTWRHVMLLRLHSMRQCLAHYRLRIVDRLNVRVNLAVSTATLCSVILSGDTTAVCI